VRIDELARVRRDAAASPAGSGNFEGSAT
jgi:hypothetical protein